MLRDSTEAQTEEKNFRDDIVYHEIRTVLQPARMAKKMTQAQFTTNIKKSVINNEYEPGKTIPNDTILTATDLEKKFRFTRAVSNRGKIDDRKKLMTSTPMILRAPRVQSLEDQSARKRWCSKRRRVMKFLQEANTVSITNYTQVAREDEVSIATFAEELKANSERLSASKRGVRAEHHQ